MKYRIGVDIGGTSVKLGAVDAEYNVIEKLRFPTGRGCTSEDIINGIIENCRILARKYPIESIGIGSAGRVDSVNGKVLVAGNLPFVDEPVAKKVGDALSLPCYIDNDGSCALIGEKTAGACKGCRDALIITIGTGIGGAILIGDKVVRGHNNRAGELGHFTIDMSGPECECGLYGCFERYASATSLIEHTAEAADNDPDSILAKEAASGVDGTTAFRAAKLGCPVAKQLLEKYGEWLAVGINSLVHIFQPEMIVLSGGIANEGENLLALIRPHLFPEANVAVTKLKGNGGIIGASLLGTPHSA